MSTRCQIKFVNGKKSVMLYHHCDGYIEGVGFDLVKRVKKNIYADEMLCKMIRECHYEVTVGNHLDIEYFYIVDFKKETVKGQAVNNWEKPMKALKEFDCNSLYNPDEDVNLYEDNQI